MSSGHNMLPVLSSAQVRGVELATMKGEPITSLELMERAAARCVVRILDLMAQGRFGPDPHFVIVAGMGNNGGDGLVIARLLFKEQFPVRVLRLIHRPEPSEEHAINYQMLLELKVKVIDIKDLNEWLYFADNEVIIDSIFGSGLSRSPDGSVKAVIDRMNSSGRPIVSVDLPSGMVEPGPDRTFDPRACIVARHTLTFEVPRPGLLLPETGPFAGNWELVPIGMEMAALEAKDRFASWVRTDDIRSLLHPRPRFSHKGTYGHALICGGSTGLFGAAVLATSACLRSGAGLTTAHVPAGLAAIMPSGAPEAMCSADPSIGSISELPDLGRFSAVGIGPGMGTSQESLKFVHRCLEVAKCPVVLDADALNFIGPDRELLSLLTANMVLTPHPGEMDRLLGSRRSSGLERLERTMAFATEYGCTVVLKGAYSVICTPDGQAYFSSTGNAGMAKGGSGDALTGLLTGILAQGYSVLDACLIATNLHGSAGDLAAVEQGMDGMTAMDLVRSISKAWKALRG